MSVSVKMWKCLIPLLLFSTTTAQPSTTYAVTVTLSKTKTKSGSLRILTPTKDLVTPTNCGGAGSLVETRVSGCHELPCPLTYSTTIEIDFFPSAHSSTPLLRITLTPNSTGVSETEEGFLGGDGDGDGLQLDSQVPSTITLSHFQEHVTREELVMEVQIINDNMEREICISGTFNAGLKPPPPSTSPAITSAPITSTYNNKALALYGQFTPIFIIFTSLTHMIKSI